MIATKTTATGPVPMIKRMLAAAAAVLFSFATVAIAHDYPPAKPYHWEVVRVVDGDTVEVRANWLPVELSDTIMIRLYGADAPETTWRAKCEAEIVKGRLSVAALSKMLLPTTEVVIVDWDKYGGRILGDFKNGDKSVTAELIAQGHLQSYSGSGPKPSWCD